MNPQAAQNYLRTRVLTATPEQLQMMLYDGALRFAEQARAAMEARDYDKSYSTICRAQKILTEMTSGLKHDVFPELCGKLASLYNFAYRKLVDANVHRNIEAIDEALAVLRYQRETWALLMDQIGRHKAGAAAAKLNIPAPEQRMEESLRVSA